jgi:hypothetical protein
MYIKLHIDFMFKDFHLVHVMMFHLLATVILLILDHNPPAVQLINIFGSHTAIVQAVILNGHIGMVVIIMILLFLLVLYLVIGILQISYIFLQLLLGGLLYIILVIMHNVVVIILVKHVVVAAVVGIVIHVNIIIVVIIFMAGIHNY